jgi:hypothetical protein
MQSVTERDFASAKSQDADVIDPVPPKIESFRFDDDLCFSRKASGSSDQSRSRRLEAISERSGKARRIRKKSFPQALQAIHQLTRGWFFILTPAAAFLHGSRRLEQNLTQTFKNLRKIESPS